ncbi:Uncharacterized protein Fot_35854 [Forsythia ovata]|uniref:Uncharacterized protein n=1 Tax=Forsythia ovata TaxID=205694 RepID=A0ABD1SNG3_9LAMI
MGKKNRGALAPLKQVAIKGSVKNVHSSVRTSDKADNFVGKSSAPLDNSVSKDFWKGLCQDSPDPSQNCSENELDAASFLHLPTKPASVVVNSDSQVVQQPTLAVHEPALVQESAPVAQGLPPAVSDIVENPVNHSLPSAHIQALDGEGAFTLVSKNKKRSNILKGKQSQLTVMEIIRTPNEGKNQQKL